MTTALTERRTPLPRDLSVKLTLWLPLLIALALYSISAWCKYRYPIWSGKWLSQIQWYEHWFHGESGCIEIASAVFLLIAIAIGIASIKSFQLELVWVKRWLVLLLLATVYFAGEEISWGQHLLGWETPQWYQTLTGNRQKETNFHNINSWLNQKPRILFTLWVVIGGILLPLRRKLKGYQPCPSNDWEYWFWPTSACSLTTILVIVSKLPEWIVTVFHIHDGVLLRRIYLAPPSETQEMFLAIFLMIYFASVYKRVHSLREHSD